MSGKTSGLKLLLTGGACAVALFTAAPGPTQAALNSCPADFTLDGSDAKVLGGPAGTETAASDCQYIVPPDSSNVASIGNINANDFFGFDDWESNGQDQIGPGGAFGTWSIASVDFATYDYLIA